MYNQKATLCMKSIKQTNIYKEKKETKIKKEEIESLDVSPQAQD